jgi:three-Cys-motif partner protein
MLRSISAVLTRGQSLPEEKYEVGEDGLLREIVGDWALEKHERLKRYVDISRHARRKFLSGRSASASYIDLFSGTGQCRIRDTTTVIDGSPLVAFRAAHKGGQAFTQIHLGDINPEAVMAAQARIAAIGGTATAQVGTSEDVAHDIVRQVSPYGLHFALLDPYKLESLSFQTIRVLSDLKHVDMLLHVSAMDLQRNLDSYVDSTATTLDEFAPGWRAAVHLNRSRPAARAALLNYWCDLIEKLGFARPRYDLITGSKNQRLYWLAFVSREPIANDFWDKIRYISGQGDLLTGL